MFQCAFLLLHQLLSDPQLASLCETLARINEKAVSVGSAGGASHRAVDYGALPTLPKPVQILQQPLFDLLRTVFSRGDHSVYSALTFHNAVQLWLVYIQPWKASKPLYTSTSHSDFIIVIIKEYARDDIFSHFYFLFLFVFVCRRGKCGRKSIS